MEDAQTVNETIESPAEQVSFGGLISDTHDRSGTHTMHFRVFSLTTGARTDRTWSGSGDDYCFVDQALKARALNPDLAAQRLRHEIYVGSGCSCATAQQCERAGHGEHAAWRRRYTAIAEHLGLL